MNPIAVVVIFILFWLAPALVVRSLCKTDGKDPMGPILGALFFSWPGGLIIWALIKPDPEIIAANEESERYSNSRPAPRPAAPRKELTAQRKAELEKLLRVPKSKM